MGQFLTIRKVHQRFKAENPDALLGENAIRQAVRSGSLKSRKIGNRAYIDYGVFLDWLMGE